MKKQNFFGISLFFLGIFAFSFCVFSRHFVPNLPTSPDNLAVFQYAAIFRETGKMKYQEPLAEKYESPFFGFRGSAYSDNGFFVPNTFPGFIVYTAIFQGLGDGALFLSIPLLVLLCSLFFYGIARRFFEKEWAIIATMALNFSGPFLINANVFYNNIFTTTFFLGFLLFFLRWISTKKSIDFFVAEALAAIAFWGRIDIAFFFILIAVFFWKEIFIAFRHFQKKDFFFAMGIFFLFAIPWALLSIKTYGHLLGYFSPGMILGFPEETNKMSVFEKIWGYITTFQVSIFFENIFRFLVFPAPILMTAFFFFFFQRKKDEILFRLCLLFLFGVLFYFRGTVYGFHNEEMGYLTSYLRYLLPLWGIVILVFVWQVQQIPIRPFFRLLIFIPLFFIHGFFAVFGKDGIEDMKDQKYRTLSAKNTVQKAPENTVFLVRRKEDKIIFSVGGNPFWYLEDEHACKITKKMNKDGIRLFMSFGTDSDNFIRECGAQKKESPKDSWREIFFENP